MTFQLTEVSSFVLSIESNDFKKGDIKKNNFKMFPEWIAGVKSDCFKHVSLKGTFNTLTVLQKFEIDENLFFPKTPLFKTF